MLNKDQTILIASATRLREKQIYILFEGRVDICLGYTKDSLYKKRWDV